MSTTDRRSGSRARADVWTPRVVLAHTNADITDALRLLEAGDTAEARLLLTRRNIMTTRYLENKR